MERYAAPHRSAFGARVRKQPSCRKGPQNVSRSRRHSSLENLPDAISKFWEAFDALPAIAESNDDGESGIDDDDDDDDEQDSFARLFIVGAVGNLNFLNEDYTAGADNLRGLGTHPFGLLRFGQCLFELGADEEFAADILAQAYMLAGREIFAEEDPKYIEFLTKFLRPPAGQTEL